VARAYAVLKAAKANLIAKKAAKRKLDKKYWQSMMHCEEEAPIYVMPTTPDYYCPSSPSCYVPSMPCYCP